MVRGVKHIGRTLYICKACGFDYDERSWAEKCQKGFQERQSCNLEISQHAIPLKLEGESDNSKRE
jgi:hypothetical protein